MICATEPWVAKPRVLYICDKDFDDILDLKDDDVIYSDYYSIESYLCCSEFSLYVLEKEARESLSKVQRRTFTDAFEARLQAAAESMKFVSALMIELRRDGVHPNFDSASLNDFFELERFNLKARALTKKEILDLWAVDSDINMQRITITANSLNDIDYKIWLRGKYLLQLTKKVFSITVWETLKLNNTECAQYFGKSGLKFAKLAIPQLAFLQALQHSA